MPGGDPVPPVPDAALLSPRPGVLPKPGRGGYILVISTLAAVAMTIVYLTFSTR